MNDNSANSSSSNSKAKMNKLFELIEQKKITTEHFNQLIESLPKGTTERIRRRTVPKKITPIHPDPLKKAEKSLARFAGQKAGAATSPHRTRRGTKAVKERGEENKKNADRFNEAVKFILQNNSKPIDECVNSIVELEHPDRLVALATRLNAESTIDIDKDWLQTLICCLK